MLVVQITKRIIMVEVVVAEMTAEMKMFFMIMIMKKKKMMAMIIINLTLIGQI